MAEIIPLRAWRYHPQWIKNIDELTSPLFDVISERQREDLYKKQFNSIHLSVPKGDQPHIRAKELLADWKKEAIIQQDPVPGIYVYYQYFNLAGQPSQLVRKGLIANIRMYDWQEKMILHHEDTIPRSVNDRAQLIESTQLNVSPTHALYEDTSHEIERYLDEAIKAPICETEDYQGVRDVLGVIHDKRVIDRICAIIREKQIILADGHHRYEGSLAYQKKCQAANPNHTGNEAYNYHLMYLTNTESTDLRILPTHRLLRGFSNITEDYLLEKLKDYFTIKTITNPFDLPEILAGKKWALGILIGANAYKINIKPELISEIEWKIPELIKSLDLTILHYFVLEKCLGMPLETQRNSEQISYERNFSQCLHEVDMGMAKMAFITREISIETVKQVCGSGHTMPQKSTYFYPKVITGFLFGSIAQDEFYHPHTTGI